jgi:hypothetical protein
MSADLLVIIPTRGRRAQLDRFLAAAATTRQAATDLLVVIDDDDTATYEGLALPPRARAVMGPRARLAPKLNRHAVPAARDYPAVGFLADDTVPVTPGWDRLLLGALGTPGIAYPDDRRRDDVPEHPFISSAIIAALGWFFEPSLRHYYADDVLADLGRGAGCLAYVPEAVVDHLHYQTRPGVARDATYTEAEAEGFRDRQAYQQWRASRMTADIATIAALRASPRMT